MTIKQAIAKIKKEGAILVTDKDTARTVTDAAQNAGLNAGYSMDLSAGGYWVHL